MGSTKEIKSTAMAALQAGRAVQYIPKLQQALREAPNDAGLHEMLGIALESVGRRDEALRHLKVAVQISPDKASAWANLSSIFSRKRDFARAASALRRVIALQPGQGEIWRRLGHVLRRGGDPGAARAALAESLKLNPDDPNSLHEMGLAWWAEGDPAKALPYLERALRPGGHAVFHAAAVDSVRAELATSAPAADAVRVALHMNRPFHFHILHPLFHVLKSRHPVVLSGEPDQIRRFRPDVVVVADAQAQRLREQCPDARIVFVRHGLITKQHFGSAARGADFIAGISSNHIRDQIAARERMSADRLWVTGHVPMDPLFRGEAAPLPDGVLTGNRTVLYAPTWNTQLSSLRLLGEDPVSAIRGGDEDINLIIKPHPIIAREQADLLRMLKRATHGRRNVWLVGDEGVDALPLFPHADLLLSDASSVMLAYLALDRPLVLINHPERRRDPGYDPDGMEWTWRDMGEEVDEIADLPRAVARGLAEPGAHAQARARYRRLLFDDLTDGRAAERIAGHIANLRQTQTP